MTNLARSLKQWRHDFGLTQAEAAEQLQYSLTQYGRLERGSQKADYRTYQRVIAVLEAMYAGAWIERDRGAHL
jgi:transcriptional regulator with XRE-family HTH domain